MMKGRVIINFERDEVAEKCSYDLKQEGKDTLGNEDLISLFEHIIRELISEEG
ncbi:MAG: hypothetical protein JSW60_01885 [Thermoplasmatales archaeon]|nr:MAG: hypothetical protein JSW60_01885 [Thermoplasmatales archaeon]